MLHIHLILFIKPHLNLCAGDRAWFLRILLIKRINDLFSTLWNHGYLRILGWMVLLNIPVLSWLNLFCHWIRIYFSIIGIKSDTTLLEINETSLANNKNLDFLLFTRLQFVHVGITDESSLFVSNSDKKYLKKNLF